MKRFVLLFIVVLFSVVCHAQEEPSIVRVAFWNMENFFDPFVDSTKTYNAFTEDGMQHWTKTRFYKKRNNMYKAILAMSENRPIGILGMCEVENEYVLSTLFEQTPLKKHNYRWMHYEGPDKRGIDPAIVYSLDHFSLVESAVFPYYNPEDTAYHSRDILYAKFIAKGGPSTGSGTAVADTLHVFVNHWPSRYSGELETVGSRSCSAAILRSKVDSIVAAAPEGYQPKVIMMGDLNDCPTDPSVYDVLRARHPSEMEEGCFVTETVLAREYQGYTGVAHGGIVSTMLDEAMGGYLVALGEKALTGRLSVRYRHPTPIGVKLRIEGRIEARRGNLVKMKAAVCLPDGTVTAEGTADMAVVE